MLLQVATQYFYIFSAPASSPVPAPASSPAPAPPSSPAPAPTIDLQAKVAPRLSMKIYPDLYITRTLGPYSSHVLAPVEGLAVIYFIIPPRKIQLHLTNVWQKKNKKNICLTSFWDPFQNLRPDPKVCW